MARKRVGEFPPLCGTRLANIGIHTKNDLREQGCFVVYVRWILSGFKPNLNMLLGLYSRETETSRMEIPPFVKEQLTQKHLYVKANYTNVELLKSLTVT